MGRQKFCLEKKFYFATMKLQLTSLTGSGVSSLLYLKKKNSDILLVLSIGTIIIIGLAAWLVCYIFMIFEFVYYVPCILYLECSN